MDFHFVQSNWLSLWAGGIIGSSWEVKEMFQMNVLYLPYLYPAGTPSRNLDLPSLQAKGEREETAAQESRSDQTSICKANRKAQK